VVIVLLRRQFFNMPITVTCKLSLQVSERFTFKNAWSQFVYS